MKKFLLLLLFILTPVYTSAGQFTVIRVSDGDTIRVTGYDVVFNVRLAGIDAPETAKRRGHKIGQPFSQRAKAFLVSKILHNKVDVIAYGTGPFNRPICEVFLDGKNINLELVKAGLAEVYRGKHPKKLDSSQYWKAEKIARGLKKGMWEQGNKYISPKEWRKLRQ